MAFDIPNRADAAFDPQSEPDSVDFDVLAAGFGSTGVVSGCVVTAQGTPDLTVAVAAGTIATDGTTKAVTAGNVAIATADLTNPRFDLIVVDSTGTKQRRAGTPGASPAFPALSAGDVLLAAVYVPALDLAIASNQIIDKRVMLVARRLKSFTSLTSGSGTYTVPAGITAIFVECIGGGGGGGGAGSAATSAAAGAGGAGAMYAAKWITSPDATYAYVVGAGGAGGASTPTAGSAGGDTTFGDPSVCTGRGGHPGAQMNAGMLQLFSSPGVSSPGAGVGDIIWRGTPGVWGLRLSGTMAAAGNGGSVLGGGGRGRIDAGAGEEPEAYGAGGGGGLVLNGSTAVAGAAGSAGRITVYEYGP